MYKLKISSREGGGRELMAGCSGRSAPGAIWFEGPIMHEKINQSLAHSSHVETGNGRRQRGRERQVDSVTAARMPCEVPVEAANSRSTSPLPSDKVGQRREHRRRERLFCAVFVSQTNWLTTLWRTCIRQTSPTDGTQRYPSIAAVAAA